MQDNAIPVSTFCLYIKKIFDAEELLHGISVYGEISDFKIVRGNAYFKMKDADAVLSCVFFGCDQTLKDGDKVIAVGSPNFYAKTGSFNFNVFKVKPFGVGELYKQFLETKEKLEKEGLFAESHKKQKPENIRTIGVVASETGAVIRDIINVSSRRDESVNIVLYPANVQGAYAENEIIQGIKFFESYPVDVIVVARGGGSFEDLNVFNSEKIARVVYDCEKYIVSAVGHETDYTIIDFVSDLRAPTPSAAAELLTSPKSESKRKCLKMFLNIQGKVDDIIENKIDFIIDSKRSLDNSVKYIIENYEYKFEISKKILEKHNFDDILKRGFAYIEKDNKSVTYNDIHVEDELKIVMSGGKIKVDVKDKE